MSAPSWYYICDYCGDLVTITEKQPIPEGEEWECDKCGSHALWEFTNKENALTHSRHIQRLTRSGPPHTCETAYRFGFASAKGGYRRLSHAEFLTGSDHPFPESIWRAYVHGRCDGAYERAAKVEDVCL